MLPSDSRVMRRSQEHSNPRLAICLFWSHGPGARIDPPIVHRELVYVDLDDARFQSP
jgi:hypothetical protein